MTTSVYPLYEIPQELAHIPMAEWKTKEWRFMLNHFLESIPSRMRFLLSFLETTVDNDPETDLKLLGKLSYPFFVDSNHSRTEPLTVYFQGQIAQETIATFLTASGEALAADIGLFMAKYLQGAVPESEWKIDLAKRSVDFGRPILVKKLANHWERFALFRVPAVCAMAMVDDKEKVDEFYRIFEIDRSFFQGINPYIG